jgi:hypothetical protein
MFRKPLFWIAFAALSAGSIYFAVRFFSRAFPIVALDLQMDRETALGKAKQLEARFHFGPDGFDQAASFAGDQSVQNFVELEAGGTEAFKKMTDEGLYHAYKWTVRHFKPGETRETRIRFTPRGDPYGFVVKLPENEPGATLESDSARTIADTAAANEWGIDLGKYQLEEKSQEVRPGGRVDHTFVYERSDARIGEGRYRLRLVVGGDKLTELTHLVKVPEAFSRRYEEMRSANNLISVAGTIPLVILYLIGGCGFGLFFLLRHRWINWRMPLFWGLLIALLQLLVGFNEWPLVWMNYDTAISARGFVVQQVMFILLNFLFMGFVLVLSFMAAEGLSRRAFPDHIQLWRLWSNGPASSRAVLGRTAAGYLLVGVFFAYDVLLYFVTSRTLGWWTPSDVLVQPDVLATYFPWLSSIAISAQAGFWEETLFRAVPIAGAALLGSRFGGRRWWIAGAMIVQALIFGAGHAGYANQPAYARVVELIIPSLMFGGLYLFFGLLPAVVLHFTFDVVWFALPLFVSTARGIWVDRVLVVALVLIPLWVVILARLRAKRWSELSEADLNLAWQPSQAVEAAEEERAEAKPVNQALLRYLPLAGLVGLGLWIIFADFKPVSPPVRTTRSEARVRAEEALKGRRIELTKAWEILTQIKSQPDQQDRFVWQTAGKEKYQGLMAGYLEEPHWTVRFVRFEGDVAERAEEYQVFMSDQRGVFRFNHKLPEARPGKTISESDARLLAQSALKDLFRLEASALKEVSAVPSKLKARTDWLFTFSDNVGDKLPQGEKRLAIQIAGDEVVDAYRFVHVPEEWARKERDRRAIPQVIDIACTVLIAVIIIGGVAAAILNWSRRKFAPATFLLLFAVLFVVNVASLLNRLPMVTAQFSTAQPYKTQMLLLVGMGIVGLLLLSASIGLIAGLLHKWTADAGRLPPLASWAVGVSLGSLTAGLSAIGSRLEPSLSPKWADYTPLGTYIPLLVRILDPVAGYLTQATVALFVIALVHRFTRGWMKRKPLSFLLMVLFGLVVTGMQGVDAIPAWLGSGLILGLLLSMAYLVALRFSISSTLIAVGVLQLLNIARQGAYAAFPGAVLGAAVAFIVTAAAIWFWYEKMAGAAPNWSPTGTSSD